VKGVKEYNFFFPRALHLDNIKRYQDIRGNAFSFLP